MNNKKIKIPAGEYSTYEMILLVSEENGTTNLSLWEKANGHSLTSSFGTDKSFGHVGRRALPKRLVRNTDNLSIAEIEEATARLKAADAADAYDVIEEVYGKVENGNKSKGEITF